MKRFFTLFVFVIFIPATLSAQMFSVDNSSPQVRFTSSYLRIGPVFTNFSYKGSDLVTGVSPLSFNKTGIHLGFETPGFEINLKMANKLTGLNDKNYTDFDVAFNSYLPISVKQNVQFGIPVIINSGFVSVVENDGIAENFSQFVLGINGGLLAHLKLGNALEFNNQATYGYGFSTSNGGFFGGTASRLKLESRINFLNLLKRRALSIGYNYEFRSFDIDGEQFDYDLSGHSLTVGLSF